jgi:hypothetical protein
MMAYAATNAFWIHQYGGIFCPYCIIFALVAYIFSAGFGHGFGFWLRSLQIRGKNIIVGGALFAFIAVQIFNHFRAH